MGDEPRNLVLADRHAAAGARWTEAGGWRVPADYGAPGEELAAARHSAVLLDRSHAGRLRIRGRDAASYLHRVTTQDIRSLQPGRGAEAALTDHKGRLIAFGVLQCLGEADYRYHLDPGAEQAAAAWLVRYALADDLSIEPETEATGQLSLCGPGAGRVLAVLMAGSVPGLPRHHLRVVRVGEHDVCLTAARPAGGKSWQLLAERDAMPALWEAVLGGGAPLRLAGDTVWEVLRIEAGLPAHGREITERTNPWEAGLEAAVSLDKGCYTGQETLNRLRTYGGVRRRLVGLEVRGEEAPDPGTALHDGAEEVGWISSAAAAPGEGRSVALGFVEGERVAAGFALTCGHLQARVRALPSR